MTTEISSSWADGEGTVCGEAARAAARVGSARQNIECAVARTPSPFLSFPCGGALPGFQPSPTGLCTATFILVTELSNFVLLPPESAPPDAPPQGFSGSQSCILELGKELLCLAMHVLLGFQPLLASSPSTFGSFPFLLCVLTTLRMLVK